MGSMMLFLWYTYFQSLYGSDDYNLKLGSEVGVYPLVMLAVDRHLSWAPSENILMMADTQQPSWDM